MIADEHQRPWLLQQSAMHVVDDATHRVHWEAPDAVARIIACVLQ